MEEHFVRHGYSPSRVSDVKYSAIIEFLRAFVIICWLTKNFFTKTVRENKKRMLKLLLLKCTVCLPSSWNQIKINIWPHIQLWKLACPDNSATSILIRLKETR